MTCDPLQIRQHAASPVVPWSVLVWENDNRLASEVFGEFFLPPPCPTSVCACDDFDASKCLHVFLALDEKDCVRKEDFLQPIRNSRRPIEVPDMGAITVWLPNAEFFPRKAQNFIDRFAANIPVGVHGLGLANHLLSVSGARGAFGNDVRSRFMDSPSLRCFVSALRPSLAGATYTENLYLRHSQ